MEVVKIEKGGRVVTIEKNALPEYQKQGWVLHKKTDSVKKSSPYGSSYSKPY